MSSNVRSEVRTGLLLTVAFVVSPLASEVRDFSQPKRISHRSGSVQQSRLATSGTSVYVVGPTCNTTGV